MGAPSPDAGGASSGATRHPAVTAAALLFFVSGVGWLIGLVPTIAYTAINRDLPIVFGIPAGSGPIFDAFGLEAVIVASGLHAAVHVVEIIAGYWLWESRRRGALLGLVTIAAGSVFWYGFGLPIPPWIALLQLGLMAAGWRSLR